MNSKPLIILAPLVLLLSAAALAAPPVSDVRVKANGIRKIPGRRLTLYTDLNGKEFDSLPELFEQAFPQWCDYFDVSRAKHANWHATGSLMRDRDKFVAAGLLPKNLPPFKHGFSKKKRLWLDEQPSNYYRRELLLHEGTHCFMFTVLGSCGPPWYMEGMAEYLGTHSLKDGRLTLGYMPKSRAEAPYWGRVLIIQKAVARDKPLDLKTVIEFSPTAHLDTAPYAWCWAAVTLLDRHPRYRERFRQLRSWVREPDFNHRFYRLFKPDWRELCEEWQLMIANMEYGYDVERNAIDFTPAKISPLLPGEGPGVRAVRVAADHGWQNTGLRLEAGQTYRLTATGRYQIAVSPRPLGEGPGVRAAADKKPAIWWSEPGGVSIRYYKGRPLGILLAAVRPDDPPADEKSALLSPTAVGLGTTLTPAHSGTLFLKINDSPAELADNAGEIKVEVLREK